MATTFKFEGRLGATIEISGARIRLEGTAELRDTARMALVWNTPSDVRVQATIKDLLEELDRQGLTGQFGNTQNPALVAEQVLIKLRDLPGFSTFVAQGQNLADTVVVRLTRLALELEAPDADDGPLRGSGEVGLTLEFDTAKSITGTAIKVHEVTLFVKLTVAAQP